MRVLMLGQRTAAVKATLGIRSPELRAGGVAIDQAERIRLGAKVINVTAARLRSGRSFEGQRFRP